MSQQPPKKGGRPKTPKEQKRKKPDISLSPELIEAGKIAAKDDGVSFSAYAEAAIREKLGWLPTPEPRPLRVNRRSVNAKISKNDRV